MIIGTIPANPNPWGANIVLLFQKQIDQRGLERMQSACRLCKAPIDGKRRFVAAMDLDAARRVLQSSWQILRYSWISNDAVPEQFVCFCWNRVCLLIIAP